MITELKRNHSYLHPELELAASEDLSVVVVVAAVVSIDDYRTKEE